MIKGWGLHHHHEDRYALLFGEMELVCYDAREDSPTYGEVSKLVLSEHRRQPRERPRRASGTPTATSAAGDVVVVNFPTIQYDHSDAGQDPPAARHDRIPYRFDDRRGLVAGRGGADPGTTKPRRSAVSEVPPPGIEPGTFGLRVRCSAS